MLLKNKKKVILFLVSVLGLLLFFSFKLQTVPAGITGDEASFGYNGILISRTLRDENGRKLPVFVLSLGGKDWRQPITQYFVAATFRILGPSLFNLRLTAVITATLSVILIFFLGKELLGDYGGIAAAVIMATTPIIMIQSHLGLDNITPIPFIIVWIYGLLKFAKNKKIYWLFISAISLGISFYSYKSMRIFVPVWILCSVIYLLIISKSRLKNIFIFVITIMPFFIIIPLLEFLYSGAVLNKANLDIRNIYNFLNFYLSNFDLSFLFVKGDELLFHSTGMHGMYLLASLPFFVLGLVGTWNKSNFWKFLTVSFFLGPLMFGYIGEIHRASRLMAEIPLYVLISAAGLVYLLQMKSKIWVSILILLFAVNYFDFIHYYLGNYAEDTKHLFNCFTCKEGAYKILNSESKSRDLIPLVDHVVAAGYDPVRDFAGAIYFRKYPNIWDGEKADLPPGSILMTDNSDVSFLTQVNHFGSYYFYISPK